MFQFTTSYVEDAKAVFQQYKQLAEKAMAQVRDDQLALAPDSESNSIAIIAKHLAGNMRSRWTDFLTSDGEKPNRNRDSEFENPPQTRAELMKMWDEGWSTLFHALDGLSDQDLGRTITIRGEKHSVMQAINRQVAHLASHCGQIIYLAKHLQHEHWKTLSVPRHRSAEYAQKVRSGEASQR